VSIPKVMQLYQNILKGKQSLLSMCNLSVANHRAQILLYKCL